MGKISVLFLRSALVFFGLAVLAFMLWLPPHEGRNVNATLFAVYFKDPFVAYVYLGSIPFFTALWQTFGLLGAIGRGEVFLPGTLKALKTIKRCALATAGLVAGAVVLVRVTAGANEDSAGFVMPAMLAILLSAAAAAASEVLGSIVRGGMDKSRGE